MWQKAAKKKSEHSRIIQLPTVTKKSAFETLHLIILITHLYNVPEIAR